MVTSSCLNDDTSQPYMFTSHKHYTQWNIEYYIIYPSFPQKKKSCWEWKCSLIMSCQVPTVPTSCCGFKALHTQSDYVWLIQKERTWISWIAIDWTSCSLSYISIYFHMYIYIYTYLFPIMPKYVSRFAQLWYFSPHVKFASRTTWIAQTWDSNLDFLSKIEFIEGISSWGG